MSEPRLVVTAGDPSGVGPEVALKALRGFPERGRVVLVGEACSLERDRARFAPDLDVELLPIEGLPEAEPGQVSAAGGAAALAVLAKGVDLVLAGRADAIVTGPIHKGAVHLAGHGGFQGHTEYLAERAGVDEVAMLLESPPLRVVHVSTHRSLRRATELDPARLDRVHELTADYARTLPTPEHRVLVAGLNPHAGEDGAFGTEEIEVIAPAIERARERHGDVIWEGPVPPDTCFARALGRPDTVVVAMYHDQGHIPLKLVARDDGINVTLGLPFVRTSVDHGTAHDIAGQGVARAESMVAALRAGLRLAGTGLAARG